LFSAAGHEHWVMARISSGIVDEAGATPSVRFAVEAARLEVKPEKATSAADLVTVKNELDIRFEMYRLQ
jgi:hypothetical protein